MKSAKGEREMSEIEEDFELHVDTLSAVGDVIAVMTPLLDNRVDLAWGTAESYVAAGKSSEVLRAFALLLYSMLHADVDAARASEVLRESALHWAAYTDLGEGESLSDSRKLRQLVTSRCATCAHIAGDHSPAFVLWEYGAQTNGECKHETCSCSGFTS
jgi:hypothetical protein